MDFGLFAVFLMIKNNDQNNRYNYNQYNRQVNLLLADLVLKYKQKKN